MCCFRFFHLLRRVSYAPRSRYPGRGSLCDVSSIAFISLHNRCAWAVAPITHPHSISQYVADCTYGIVTPMNALLGVCIIAGRLERLIPTGPVLGRPRASEGSHLLPSRKSTDANDTRSVRRPMAIFDPPMGHEPNSILGRCNKGSVRAT